MLMKMPIELTPQWWRKQAAQDENYFDPTGEGIVYTHNTKDDNRLLEVVDDKPSIITPSTCVWQNGKNITRPNDKPAKTQVGKKRVILWWLRNNRQHRFALPATIDTTINNTTITYSNCGETYEEITYLRDPEGKETIELVTQTTPEPKNTNTKKTPVEDIIAESEKHLIVGFHKIKLFEVDL